MASADLPSTPLLAGRYRLVRRLSRGGTADIFLAVDEVASAPCVAKVLRDDGGRPDPNEAFFRELDSMGKLRHPNVAALLDAGTTEDGSRFLIMEYAEGRTLADVMEAEGALPPEVAISVVEQIAEALDAAHQAGVVHRDLKPMNVVLVPAAGKGKPDRVKIIDFGASKDVSDPGPEQTSLVVGTPEFMSPEQAEGREAAVAPASDEFALATLAYALLAGRTPWKGRSAERVMDEVAHGEPRPLAPQRKMPAVEAVIERALAMEPARRYGTTVAFARALRRALSTDGLLAG